MYVMKNKKQKDLHRDKKPVKGKQKNSKYVDPVVAWCAVGGVFVLAVAIALVIILPLV